MGLDTRVLCIIKYEKKTWDNLQRYNDNRISRNYYTQSSVRAKIMRRERDYGKKSRKKVPPPPPTILSQRFPQVGWEQIFKTIVVVTVFNMIYTGLLVLPRFQQLNTKLYWIVLRPSKKFGRPLIDSFWTADCHIYSLRSRLLDMCIHCTWCHRQVWW